MEVTWVGSSMNSLRQVCQGWGSGCDSRCSKQRCVFYYRIFYILVTENLMSGMQTR